MRMDPIHLTNKNKLIQDYRNGHEDISAFFDYHPFKSYQQRVEDLQERTFKRDELAHVLHIMNQQWDAPKTTFDNIERLKDEQSVVVIGGQQAGVLTGPLYTLNKIISLIHCAKEQEEKLNIPVIPVFWIAGEDHDYEEINHIFLLEENNMVKHKSPQHVMTKASISNIMLDHEKIAPWVQELFGTIQETAHTKNVYDVIKSCLRASTTYVDFFARLIYELFPQAGVVLVDSDDQQLRHLESEYFVQMIENQPEISKSVYETEHNLDDLGYTTPLEITLDDAHLFVHENDERILLKRDETGGWVGKQNEIKLSTEALLDIAIHSPEKLSNNVITRPLMQELLFPSLAFVGGDGEIRYWAVLRDAFHVLNMSMPPVLPRLSLTYMPRNIEALLEKENISAEQAIHNGVTDLKTAWLQKQGDAEIKQIAEQLKQSISEAHEPLHHIAEQIRSDVGDLADKNRALLHHHVDYLQKRMLQGLEQKHNQKLGTFDLINAVLHPQQGLQERVWNILPLVNKYGFDFPQDILNESFAFEDEHYIVYM